jgi:sec-independent protein translocase protein TatC
MADETEVLPPDPEEVEGGGPVKSFLEHLEDLRWTLVKVVVSTVIGMIVCLSGSNYIFDFLFWPLKKAQEKRLTAEPQIALILGTNQLAKFSATNFPIAGIPTNRDSYFRIQPLEIGTNHVLAVVPEPNPPKEATYGMRVSVQVLGPAEAFNVAIQIMIYGGLTIAAPFIIFFLGQFILPALHVHEKKFLFRISGAASLLFFAGVAFCYFVMMVVTLSATVEFAKWLGLGADIWRATEYISFMCWFMLGMGISFQLPLVLLTLVKIGLLDARKLSDFRAYFYVAILVIAGFVTPDGNPLTMLLMAAPLVVLYELTVVIARWGERKEAAQETLADEE